MEDNGCEIICGAPTTPAVKGLMMILLSGVKLRLIQEIRDFNVS